MNQSKSSDEAHGLVRELGLTEGIAIGLGTMVGAGIFVLSALAAERAGPAAAISYVIAGGICFLIALVISELATGMPRAGGSYTFITEALGPLAGSIVGPGNWLGLTFAGGFYLLACGDYLAMVVPVPPQVASLAVGLLFTWMNYRGAKLTGSVQNVVVVILLVIGASNEWGIKSLLVGAIPDAVADQAPCSVLMVRRYETTGISTMRRVMRSVRGW